MHGVKKEKDALLARQQEQPQIAQYKDLVSSLALLRDAPDFDEASVLSNTRELLLINPDFMTAWNTRKRALEELLRQQKDLGSLAQNELAFSVDTIKANPKSYGAWYHRRWFVHALHKLATGIDARHELKLCNRLLELDGRNCSCICPPTDCSPLLEL